MTLNGSISGGLAWTTRILGTLLCLLVATIHFIDQGGFSMKHPTYVGIGFYILEVVGVITAILLLGGTRLGWFLAVGVAAGPLTGYILSPGPGLPYYTEDVGNWAEPLGVARQTRATGQDVPGQGADGHTDGEEPPQPGPSAEQKYRGDHANDLEDVEPDSHIRRMLH